MGSSGRPLSSTAAAPDHTVAAAEVQVEAPVAARGRASATGPAVAALAVFALAASEGGYFPTSWGWSAALLLWAIGLWLVLSARTDWGRLDVLFATLLALLPCWVALSALWSTVPAATVDEFLRSLVPLTAVLAVLALARRRDAPLLAGAVLAAIALISAWALGTRLFPDRLGHYDDDTYRLADPIGYWNGLGIFAVIGLLLGLGVVADATSRWARAAAAASVVVVATTLYFTYSRGAWVALALGVAALVAVTPRRLWTATAALAVAVPAAGAVLIGSRSYALTHADVPLAEAADAGHPVGLIVLLLAGVAAGIALLLHAARERVSVPPGVRRAWAAALVAVVAVAFVAVAAPYGDPLSAARQAWNAFEAPPPEIDGDLDQRLFNLSGNGRVDLWQTARAMYSAHPLTGTGAGTFERYWQGHGDAPFKVRDAHSLYVETVAELGPVGFVLVVGALLVPLVAGLRARRQALLPGVVAAYAAFVFHLGVDWDWELTAVTVAGLLTGSVALVSARTGTLRTLSTTPRVAASVAAVLLTIVAVGGLLGNAALQNAQDAVESRRFGDAVAQARRARTLMPWSPWPSIALGDAYLGQGERQTAATSYRDAIDVDGGEWRAWLGLGLASEGEGRARAIQRAWALYPRSSEIADALAEE